jgi:hypothetical protein
MKALAIALAVVFFALALCNWFGIIWTFHPKRAIAFVLLGILALVWIRFQRASQKVPGAE